jgi:hypothetical protein
MRPCSRHKARWLQACLITGLLAAVFPDPSNAQMPASGPDVMVYKSAPGIKLTNVNWTPVGIAPGWGLIVPFL